MEGSHTLPSVDDSICSTTALSLIPSIAVLPLGERLAGRIDGHVATFAAVMTEGLLAASTAVGMEVMAELMDAEATALAGPKGRHNRDRSATRQAMGSARKIAGRLGEDRNDYNTEFGPTNVELHAVSTAVDLGDAGEAIDLARTVDAAGLSPERQSRLAIDLARAHLQRRHTGDALAALLEAERQAPEQVQAHAQARETIHDLLNLAGRRATPDLLDLARRIGAVP